MFRSSSIKYIVILILCISLTGCAALQRKFVRKKKKEEKISAVITTHDYSKELRVDELYKKHFVFWKSWQSELIDKMDFNYKKRVTCFDNIIESLNEMRKYLADSKAEELEQFIKEIKSIDPDIKKKRLSKNRKYKMKRLLERTKRQIDKNFSYAEVKDQLGLSHDY